MVLLYNPRQMVFVSCRGRTTVFGRQAERDYIVTTTWHSPCAQNPAMYLIVIPTVQEGAIAAIRDEGRFVVNFMGVEFEDAAKALASPHLPHDDHFTAAGLTRAPSAMLDCPRIMEAAGWAECALAKEIESGDHVIFIGQVLHADLPHRDAKRLFHVEGERFTTTK
ncbi:MAG: flavin reductase family protein [Nanoarchaeota archaeon]